MVAISRSIQEKLPLPDKITQVHFRTINRVLRDADKQKKFGWGLIRSIGELQLLTRASYITLLLVPLLAGLWPSVTIVVNRYNQMIETSTENLQMASRELQLIAEKNSLLASKQGEISKIVTSLRNKIDEFGQDIANKSIRNAYLPNVWLWAFFASLMAAIGQLIYQIACPSVVRSASERDYINEMIDNTVKMQPNLNDVEPQKLEDTVREAVDDYNTASISGRRWAIVSFVFYTVAIVLIFLIIYDQAIKVLKSAGWL